MSLQCLLWTCLALRVLRTEDELDVSRKLKAGDTKLMHKHNGKCEAGSGGSPELDISEGAPLPTCIPAAHSCLARSRQQPPRVLQGAAD